MTRDYLLATIERAIKTAAQTALALIGTNATGITDIDWVGVGSATALAVVVSLLTSLAGVKLTPGDGPAMFGPEKIAVDHDLEDPVELEDTPEDVRADAAMEDETSTETSTDTERP